MLERFYREARAAATLNHPNICPVYDVDEIDGTHCISMGFIEGQPLSAFVRPEKPLSQKQAVQIVRKLAAGLNEAHSHGVIHRDLKPDNVMIDKRSNPVIMDFGLARRTTSDDIRMTQGGQMIGTPAYMSPEQVEGDVELMGPRSDIYSVGVILYELLTGRLPFQGSVASVLAQIIKAEPVPPGELRKGLNSELQAICLKMMAGNLDDRYASMAEVGKDLAALVKGKPTSVRNSMAGVASEGLATGDEGLSQLIAAEDHPLQGQLGVRRRSKALKFKPIQGIVAAIAVVGLLAVYVLFIRVGKQTVRLEIDDPTAQVYVDGDEVHIKNFGATIELSPGDHGLEIRRGDLLVRADSLTVFDGKNPVLKLEVLEPEKPQPPGPVPEQSTKPEPLTKPGQPTKIGPVVAKLSNRAAVEWALGVGIVLKVESGGTTRDVQNLSDLPPNPLVVRQLTVPDHVRAATGKWHHLAAFQDLREFYATGPGVDDEALTFVGQLPKLELVDLTRTRVTDAGLAKLVGLNALKTIRIAGFEDARVDVTDAAGATFLKIPSLQTLNLNSCRITDAIVPQIARLPALKDLYLYSNPITDAEIPTLKALKLSRLGLGSTKVTDASAEAFNEMTTLSTLILNSTAFSDKGLSRLTSLKLDGLYIVRCPITQDALKKWMSANPDTEVYVEYGVTISGSSDPQPATTASVPPISAPFNFDDGIPEAFLKSKVPVVRTIGWMISRKMEAIIQFRNGTSLSSKSVRKFTEVPTVPFAITHVTLSSSSVVGKDDWGFLKSLPDLDGIVGNKREFNDEALSMLIGHSKLRSVHFSGCGVSDDGIEYLSSLPNLRSITFYGSDGNSTLPGISDNAVPSIARLRGVTSVTLSKTLITNEGFRRMVSSLPQLNSLTLLGGQINDDGITSIRGLRQLSTLSLNGPGYSDRSIAVAATLPQLSGLHLSGTSITDNGLRALANHPGISTFSCHEQRSQITAWCI
jgi:Leucine-rich repeat (LRR) protein